MLGATYQQPYSSRFERGEQRERSPERSPRPIARLPPDRSRDRTARLAAVAVRIGSNRGRHLLHTTSTSSTDSTGNAPNAVVLTPPFTNYGYDRDLPSHRRGTDHDPERVAREVRIEPGNTVVWGETDSGIVLRKVIRDEGRGMWVDEELSSDEREAIARELEDDLRRRRDTEWAVE